MLHISLMSFARSLLIFLGGDMGPTYSLSTSMPSPRLKNRHRGVPTLLRAEMA